MADEICNEETKPLISKSDDCQSQHICKKNVEVHDYELGGSLCSETDESIDINNEQIKDLLHVKLLSSQYESLDYDICENSLYQKDERSISEKTVLKKEVCRWFVMFLIGVSTGLVACVINILVRITTKAKYDVIKHYVDLCVNDNCMYLPLLILVSFNIGIVMVSAMLTVYKEPVAAGSGIPQIKCFLNGVKIPHVVRLKTLVVKVIGVIGAVSGGLCVGKEGPMIHSGAVLAAGISQGRSISFNLNFKVFEYFRSDTEKRDFVAGGAAAGVAAAFGAPIGGVLFSLEEGASFWNQALVWRIFFASMMSTFTLNVVMSFYYGHPWALSYPGLINFGKINMSYQGVEIPIFMVMGIIGGLLGALFNHINYKLSAFRNKYMYRRWTQVIEAMIVAGTTATAGYFTIFYMNVCERIKKDSAYPVQFFCEDGYHSYMAKMFFQTPEESVKHLLHDQPGTYIAGPLAVYVTLYFLLAVWTYGLSVPSGLFIPSLLVGAAWGRLVGLFVAYLFPSLVTEPATYALVGAAAQLGGVVRMTISLTVIIIEATSSVTMGLPVMVVLMISKWVGDIFNEGLYDIHIRLQGVPLLGWEPPEMSANIFASEVMSHPVTVVRTTEDVSRIVEILRNETHNGFPVVEDYNPYDDTNDCRTETFGVFRGLILRSQLLVLLKYKVFNEADELFHTKVRLVLKDFRDMYPRFPPIHHIHISNRELNCTIDLKPFMNPAAYTVEDSASLPRMFRLFRALGMRHLIVLNKQHRVVGMVSRKDLARYRTSRHRGRFSMEELLISSH